MQIENNYLAALSILAAAFALAYIAKRIAKILTRHLGADQEVTKIFSNFIAFLIASIGILYTVSILGIRLGPLLGTLGIGGVAIAFALQNLVLNLLGSFLIHTRRPFRKGDQVKIQEHQGTVIDINTRAVVLLTYNGTFVHIPNTKVMEDSFINLTKEPNRRSTINVQVAYGTDLTKALKVAVEATKTCTGIVNEVLADAIVTEFMGSGINIQVRFWHPSEQLLAERVYNDIAVSINNSFEANRIEIPLPQSVVHHKAAKE